MLRLLLIFFLLVAAVDAQKQGHVTVRNGTDKSLYIVINGRNQGDVAAGSYMEYSVPLGEVKVEAYKGYTTNDPYAKKWTTVSANYPCSAVDFTDYDF